MQHSSDLPSDLTCAVLCVILRPWAVLASAALPPSLCMETAFVGFQSGGVSSRL